MSQTMTAPTMAHTPAQTPARMTDEAITQMAEVMTAPATVHTSAPKARKTPARSSLPTLRDSVEKQRPKERRKSGRVVSTILFDPKMDEDLSALSFAWSCDRSAIARLLIARGLRGYDISEEVRKAADRFARAVSGNLDETKDRHDGGDDESDEKTAA